MLGGGDLAGKAPSARLGSVSAGWEGFWLTAGGGGERGAWQAARRGSAEIKSDQMS